MTEKIIDMNVYRVVPDYGTGGFPETPYIVIAGSREDAIRIVDEVHKDYFNSGVGEIRSIERLSSVYFINQTEKFSGSVEPRQKKPSIAELGVCECCMQGTVQYILKDPGRVPTEYKICANCLSYLVRLALTPTLFFNLLRNGHTVREHLLHEDYYDGKIGKALQPR